MTLDDAIFNWLQIKYVAEQRMGDHAAQETYQFFGSILKDDFQLSEINVEQKEGMYLISFVKDEQLQQKQFPKEFVHQLFEDIINEPKYNE